MMASSPQAGPAESNRDDETAALGGLVRVDSLLALPDPAGAVAVAESLRRRFGDHPVFGWQIDGRLGLALLANGDPEAAVPYLESIVRSQPREATHHRNLGAALLELKRRGRALSEYRVAAELAPGDADLRREYGQLLLSFGDVGRAAVELAVAAELCGHCPAMDEPLAALYLRQKDFAAAAMPLQRLYERDPKSGRRRILVATLAEAKADSSLIATVSSVPAVERTRAEWRFLVEAEGRLGRWEESLRVGGMLNGPDAAEASSAIRNEAPFWGQVALNLLAAGALEKSLAAAERAVMLEPDNVVYRNNRVVILTRLGRDEEARREWEKVLALDPARQAEAR